MNKSIYKLLGALLFSMASMLVNAQINAQFLGRYSIGTYNSNGGVAEISAYDPSTKRMYVVNGPDTSFRIVNLANPANPVLISTISVKPYGIDVTSITTNKKGLIAIAVIDSNGKTNPSSIVFLDANGNFISKVKAGANTDHIIFTPNGNRLLCANEGEPNVGYTIDPEGSISIIDVSGGAASVTQSNVQTAGFTAFNAPATIDPNIRILGRIQSGGTFLRNSTVAEDLEPEYIAVSDDNSTAWVTCQENNALAVININTATVSSLLPLGFKNHNLTGNGLDPSDQSGAGSTASISIGNWPVFGMYQPDGISSYRVGGQTFLVTANEGDARADWGAANNEEVRVNNGTYVLDTVKFGGAANVAALKANAAIGRLNVSNRWGDFNNDGRFDSIFTFGSRSFSIWNGTTGALVWDSKDDFEQRTAALFPANFNCGHTTNALDDRSDNKGPEPESVTIGKIGDSTYAFVGLERIGGFFVYNITNPNAPYFIQYVNTRNFSVTPSQANLATVGDLGPEGIVFIPAAESPNGTNMIMLSNEVSGTVSLYTVNTPQTAGVTKLQDYQNNTSPAIGTFQGINYREAGFSSLFAIPNTNGTEFWTCSDRGVNVDAANANTASCRPTYDKIYGFPSYVPKIHRIRLVGDSVQILNSITIKRPNGAGASGIINPTGLGSTAAEIASTDTVQDCANFSLKTTPKDTFGIDPEGLIVDRSGNFWLCEEGGATVWQLSPTGVLLKRYTPYFNRPGLQSVDMQMDTCFKYRRNNRGFEGIAITPNGKIYAAIQSPMHYPSSSVGTTSRVHRIVEIDPATNTQRMLVYLNDGTIGASGANQIRPQDWKIGDMTAINDSTFLVLDAAARGTSDIKRMYMININQATVVNSGLYGGLTVEALADSTGLANNGIKPVTKTLVMDLLASGWPAALDKAEGLAIINDSTIAIGNDNDFGQSSPTANGIGTATGNISHVITYRLSGAKKLANFTPLTYTLQILHSSDMESGLAAVVDAPNYAAIVDKLEDQYANNLILSSGDNTLPGPFLSSGEDPSLQTPLRNTASSYYSGTQALRAAIGRPDIAIMNIIGFNASALGNHEFDLGTSDLNGQIGVDIRSSGADKRWIGAQFPYVSCNLNFSNDINLSYLYTNQILRDTAFRTSPNITANSQKRGLAPSVIIERGGQKIGIVGATTQVLAKISSPGLTSVIGPQVDDMPALAAIIQPVVDSLIAKEGVNKIILLAHLQQLANEKALAPLLRNVDILISGGNHAFTADGNDRLTVGHVATEKYPIMATSLNNQPMVILNTTSEWKYVGRFVCNFDNAGVLLTNTLDSVINGVYVSDSAMVTSLWGNYNDAFATGTKGANVRTICNAINSVIIAKDGNKFGKSNVFLEGRRNFVRTEETNFGNLTSDANLWYARQYDNQVRISIKNGGGIRSAIGFVNAVGANTILENTQANPTAGKLRGDISQLDIENSLRFNNGLVIASTNAAGLKRLLEHGIAATMPNATPGQFPQVGGVQFSYDTTRTIGNKILSLVVTDSAGNRIDTIVRNGVLFGDTARTFKLVTLNFLFTGGDSYPFPTNATNRVNLDTAIKNTGLATFAAIGSEQDAFAEYMGTFHATNAYNVRDTSLQGDRRIQLRNARSESIFPETNPAITITQARAVAPPNTIRIRGIVTRAWGRFIYIQDGTAGIGIRQSAGAMVDSITAGRLKEGDSVEVIGPRNDFNNYAQVQLASGAYNATNTVMVLASNRIVTPITLTVKQVNQNGEQFESRLVRIVGLRTNVSGTFAASSNNTVWDGTTAGDTTILRVIAAADTEIDDVPATNVPEGVFIFEGILAQFCSSPTNGCSTGYQLYGVRKKDIIALPNAFNLLSPSSNTRVETESGNTTPIQINWSRSLNAVNYKWFLTTTAGNFTSPLLVQASNNSGADTTLTLTSGGVDAILAGLNIAQGDSVQTKWTVFAYKGTDSLQASQVFNITLARKKPGLSTFNLVGPANNARLEVEENNTTAVNINWTKSTNATTYRWFATTSTGSFTAPLLRVASNNAGTDSVLTLTSGGIDNILNSLNIKRTDSVTLKWTVFAYIGSDSLKASQDWNITLVRKRILGTFNLTAPANNARVEVIQNSSTPIVITWSASSKASKYKWKAATLAGNFNTPLLNLDADNAGADAKLTLTSGAIDAILANNSIKRGDSITLKWTVFALETTDSLKAVETFNITLIRKRILGTFNLTSPANNARVVVTQNSTTPVVINWSASANAAKYKWKATTLNGNFNTPLLNLDADNAGAGTSLTLTSGAIDGILANNSIAKGDSLTLQWTVFSFETTDSLKAVETFNVKLVRAKDIGINNIDVNNNFSVYPNPAQTELNISTNNLIGNMNIKLHSLTGKLLIQENMDATINNKIDVSNLQDGIYMLSIEGTNGKTTTIKVVIMH